MQAGGFGGQAPPASTIGPYPPENQVHGTDAVFSRSPIVWPVYCVGVVSLSHVIPTAP